MGDPIEEIEHSFLENIIKKIVTAIFSFLPDFIQTIILRILLPIDTVIKVLVLSLIATPIVILVLNGILYQHLLTSFGVLIATEIICYCGLVGSRKKQKRLFQKAVYLSNKIENRAMHGPSTMQRFYSQFEKRGNDPTEPNLNPLGLQELLDEFSENELMETYKRLGRQTLVTQIYFASMLALLIGCWFCYYRDL